ncbi:MAG: kefB [Geminicoccaceae bacterium]|nr:kefB [Geminicoccaceae bacterium]
MPEPNILRDLLVFLLAPVVVVPLFRRLRVSPILGYLAAGALIGPEALGLIAGSPTTHVLAELGVAFLLFAIGLELSLERLRVMRRLVFGLGTAQVLLTAALIAALAWTLGMDVAAAIIVGGGLALSSTAFVLQLLVERGEQVSVSGRAAFAILLFQDLAVVPLLVLVPVFALDPASIAAALAVALLKAVLALASILLAGRFVLRPVLHAVASARSPELFVSATLLVVLGTGWLTTQAGLSMPLGAFLAGLLLAESEYRHQVEADIRPFRGLLLGFFFMTVGLSLDVGLVAERLGVLFALMALLLLGKALLIGALCLLFRLPGADALHVGLLLAAGGEFAFVVFEAAQGDGLLTAEVGQVLMAGVALSMVATPFLAEAGSRVARRLRGRAPAMLASLQDEALALSGHVIIAGFGRVGQIVAAVLSAAQVPYLALDLDPGRVGTCRARGLRVFYGDASRLDVLAAAGAGRASAVVVTMDQPAGVERAVAALHEHFPALRLFVRSRNIGHRSQLVRHGATAVVPEAAEASLQLGSLVLSTLGFGADAVVRVTHDLRRADYAGLQEIEGDLGTHDERLAD